MFRTIFRLTKASNRIILTSAWFGSTSAIPFLSNQRYGTLFYSSTCAPLIPSANGAESRPTLSADVDTSRSFNPTLDVSNASPSQWFTNRLPDLQSQKKHGQVLKEFQQLALKNPSDYLSNVDNFLAILPSFEAEFALPEAYECFQRAKIEGMDATAEVYCALIRFACRIDLRTSALLVTEVRARRLMLDYETYDAMIDACVYLGELRSGLSLLDEMIHMLGDFPSEETLRGLSALARKEGQHTRADDIDRLFS